MSFHTWKNFFFQVWQAEPFLLMVLLVWWEAGVVAAGVLDAGEVGAPSAAWAVLVAVAALEVLVALIKYTILAPHHKAS